MGRYSWSYRTIVEECDDIDVFWLRRHDYFCGFNRGRVVWRYGSGKEANSVDIEVLVHPESVGEDHIRFSYTVTDRGTREKRHLDYKVELVTTPCNFGKFRYWFVCPLGTNGRYCGRRVAKLYLPGRADYFGCRHCYNLTYRSQKEHKRKPVDYQKLLEKIDEFRKRYKKRKRRSKKKAR